MYDINFKLRQFKINLNEINNINDTKKNKILNDYFNNLEDIKNNKFFKKKNKIYNIYDYTLKNYNDEVPLFIKNLKNIFSNKIYFNNLNLSLYITDNKYYIENDYIGNLK